MKTYRHLVNKYLRVMRNKKEYKGRGWQMKVALKLTDRLVD